MRIGIDAKWFFTGPVSTRVIFENLLPKLFQTYTQFEWYIFLDKRDQDKQFPFKQPNINLIYVWSPTNMVSNIVILPFHGRKLKLDLILFQTYPGFSKGCKSIVFIHDVLFRDYPQYFTWKEKLYFVPLPYFTRRADRLIATTEYVSSKLKQHKFVKTSSPIDIVPLGVNPDYKQLEFHNAGLAEKVKQKFRLPADFLLFVGRLNARKNIETLLKALPLLKNKSIPLVIVGKADWKKPQIKELINSPELKDRVIMTGGVDEDELIILYALAKIFCFPSYAEGFGLPPLEAMASGVPVVVSNTTSLSEVCGDSAYFIDPHKKESIASAINNLLEDEALYATLKLKGLERSKKFSWAITSDKIVDSIFNALKN